MNWKDPTYLLPTYTLILPNYSTYRASGRRIYLPACPYPLACLPAQLATLGRTFVVWVIAFWCCPITPPRLQWTLTGSFPTFITYCSPGMLNLPLNRQITYGPRFGFVLPTTPVPCTHHYPVTCPGVDSQPPHWDRQLPSYTDSLSPCFPPPPPYLCSGQKRNLLPTLITQQFRRTTSQFTTFYLPGSFPT